MTQLGSTRFEGDSWDLASSVGATATMVAAARAVASRGSSRPGALGPLIQDQFAEPLVRAVGIDFFTHMAGGELDTGDLDDDAASGLQRFADAMGMRTKYFDDFFLNSARDGIQQAVILAAGLDSRAFRLPWPSGTIVYEVDQPQVVEFKTTTLAALGAEPTADRRTVAIDLRNDWPAALKAAGFDPAQRTAWIAEGLLGDLPAEAQDRLLDQITALSVPGSRFATEGLPDINGLHEEELRRRMQRQSERWNRHGFELDMAGLVYFDDRTDAGTYLTGHGWQTDSTSTSDLVARHGLPPIDDDDAPFGDVNYVCAELK
jgi:methyltransferase (TIGR00027 family)